MKIVDRYLWFVAQAFDGMAYFWPITFILFCLVCATATNYFQRENLRLSLRYLLIFSPLLFIIGALSLGVFLRFSYNETPGIRPPSWPSNLMWGLFWVQIALAAFISYRLKEVRWLAINILGFEVWFAFWCSTLADMSVTDDWL